MGGGGWFSMGRKNPNPSPYPLKFGQPGHIGYTPNTSILSKLVRIVIDGCA